MKTKLVIAIFFYLACPLVWSDSIKEVDINNDGVKEKIVYGHDSFGSGGRFTVFKVIQGNEELFTTTLVNSIDKTTPLHQGVLIKDVTKHYQGKEIIIWRDWFRLEHENDKYTKAGRYYIYWYGWNKDANRFELYSAITTNKEYQHFNASDMVADGIDISGESNSLFRAIRQAKQYVLDLMKLKDKQGLDGLVPEIYTNDGISDQQKIFQRINSNRRNLPFMVVVRTDDIDTLARLVIGKGQFSDVTYRYFHLLHPINSEYPCVNAYNESDDYEIMFMFEVREVDALITRIFIIFGNRAQ